MDSSCEGAERATFTSVANCYLREVDAGSQCRRTIGAEQAVLGIEWRLPHEGAVLFAELAYRSLTGPHVFGRLWKRPLAGGPFEPVERIWAALLLVRASYAAAGAERGAAMRMRELELIGRVVSSCQAMKNHLDLTPSLRNADSFIEAEQSLVYGHWLHPTPKSRQGMTDWQEPTYAPERHGRFQLVLFAADRQLVRHDSADILSAPEIVDGIFAGSPELREGEVPVPVHPLQADALMLDPAVKRLLEIGKLRRIGPYGPVFTATSSVRTVFNPDHPWMLKFSLPVRITNSLRVNRRDELDAGVAMARFFQRSGFLPSEPKFRVIGDPAWMTIDLPGRAESGFELILRENPFTGEAQNGVITIAALTADPRPGGRSRLDRLTRDLAERTGTTTAHAARLWFNAYLDSALDPAVRLYDRHGVALEAHQQNSLIDISAGWPGAFHYRDNQGYYLSQRHRQALTAVVPELAAIPSMFFDDADIRRWFAYYLVVNQIFSLISRFGRDGLVGEDVLIALFRRRLETLAATLAGVGRDFVRELLDRPDIASKANLMTRVHDIDEFDGGAESEATLFSPIRNPLFDGGGSREAAHAIAS
jgi:siderophore synthetase component